MWFLDSERSDFMIDNNEKNKEEKYETCIVCGIKTDIKVNEPIDNRYGYVQGAGQLCYGCYQKIKEESSLR